MQFIWKISRACLIFFNDVEEHEFASNWTKSYLKLGERFFSTVTWVLQLHTVWNQKKIGLLILLNCEAVCLKLQLHDAIYRLRFYSNSLIHILSLSNSHNNVASIQKNRGDKSHRVIVALQCLQPCVLKSNKPVIIRLKDYCFVVEIFAKFSFSGILRGCLSHPHVK